MNAVNKAVQNHQKLGNIIEQCQEFLASRVNISVVFIKKQANKIAHKLTRLPCELNSFTIIMSPPLFLLETLLF